MDYSSYLNSISRLYEEPYYSDDYQGTYQQLTTGDIFRKVIKAEIALNALRFGYGAAGALGLTTRLSATTNRTKYSFYMRSLMYQKTVLPKPFVPGYGLFASLIESFDPVRSREIREFYKAHATHLANVIRRKEKFDWRKLTGTPKFTPRPYDSILGSKEAFEKFSKNRYMDFLNNRLIKPAEMHNLFRDILPDDLYHAYYDSMDELVVSKLRKLRKPNLIERMLGKVSKEYQKLEDDIRLVKEGKISPLTVIPQEEVLERLRGKGLFSIISKETKVPRAIARVRTLAEKVTFRIPWKLAAVTTGRWKTHEANAMNRALLQAYEDMTKGTVPLGEFGKQQIREFSSQYVNRLGYARLVKATAAAFILPDLALRTVATAARGILSIPKKIRSIVNPLPKEPIMTSRMATERQRAVMAIQDSQYNARYLLGNEASLYH